MELLGEGENTLSSPFKFKKEKRRRFPHVKYLTAATDPIHGEHKGCRCSALEQKILCVLSFLSINENRSLWLEYGFKCIDKSPSKYQHSSIPEGSWWPAHIIC